MLRQIARQAVVTRPREQHGRRLRLGVERLPQFLGRHAERTALRQHVVRA